ncbi:MAG: hypothetical protein R6V54_07810 [Desulfobacteraceae bacterium]
MKGISSNPELFNKLSARQETPKKDGPSPKQAFGAVMAEKLNQSSESLTAGKAGPALGELSAPSPFGVTSKSQESVPERIGIALDLLDQYSKKLQDPSTSLKELYPVLEEIGERTDVLAEEMTAAAPGDGELKETLDQVITMVKVEQAKMERGDYTPNA